MSTKSVTQGFVKDYICHLRYTIQTYSSKRSNVSFNDNTMKVKEDQGFLKKKNYLRRKIEKRIVIQFRYQVNGVRNKILRNF